MPKKQNLENKGNYVGNLTLVKFRNKDCKTTELKKYIRLLLQVLPVRIVTLLCRNSREPLFGQ